MLQRRDDYIRRLREENEELLEEIRQLKEAAPPSDDLPFALLGLSKTQGALVAALMRASPAVLSKESLMDAIYGFEDDHPAKKVIDVMASHVRRVLRAHDITLEAHWGVGLRMDRASAERLRDICRDARPARPHAIPRRRSAAARSRKRPATWAPS